MALELHIADQTTSCDGYQEAEQLIVNALRSWQAFDDMTKPLAITIQAHPDDGSHTLSVHVHDTVKSQDIFGRP